MKLRRKIATVFLSMMIMISAFAILTVSTQAATSDLTASNISSGIKLKWTKNTSAKGYYIYRNNQKIKTISSKNTLTYTDTSALKNGSKYSYKVVPYTTSSKLSASTKTTYRLNTPSITRLISPSHARLKVTYSSNVKATGYQVQYSRHSDFSSSKKITVKGSSVTSKTIASLSQGKKYYVRIRSYKTVSGKNYYSGWSAKKSVTIKILDDSGLVYPTIMVLVAPNELVFHSSFTCGNADYSLISYGAAIQRGLTPCKKCKGGAAVVPIFLE